jgi:hypothetical protein
LFFAFALASLAVFYTQGKRGVPLVALLTVIAGIGLLLWDRWRRQPKK